MNRSRSHRWVDERSLALAHAVADKIRRDPSLFAIALGNLQRWKGTIDPWPPALQEWEAILPQGADAALAVLTEDSPRGRRLRQSAPFAGVLRSAERDAIFRAYEQVAA